MIPKYKMFLNKNLPYYVFIIGLTLLNPYMLMDSELIIFFSLSLVVLLGFVNLSDFISKFYFNKLLEFRYNYIKNYNAQLWYIFLFNNFINLRLYIFILPAYLKWYSIYFTQINFFFSNSIGNLLNNFNKLNALHSFFFLKRLKLELFSFYVLYFSFFKFKVACLFRNEILANYRLMSFYLLKHHVKPLVALNVSKFETFKSTVKKFLFK